MMYLILAILFSTAIFVVMRLFSRFNLDNHQALMWNYATATVIGYIMSAANGPVTSPVSEPWFPLSILTDGLAALETHDAALPVISVKDATYRSVDGKDLSEILPRSELYSGQSPECFRYGPFVRAHAQFRAEEIALIRGCSELVFRAGLRVKLIPGIEQNFKITTKEDLQAFTLLVG